MMTRREAFLALTLIPGVGPVTIRRLLDRFPEPQEIFRASPRALQEVRNIGPALAAAIHGWESTVDLGREKRRIREIGAEFVTLGEENYPALLREIPDPPPGLYVLGQILDCDTRSIAVVGSRRATHYGISCARKLSEALSGARMTVVSGLARGIDTAAHEGALAADGRTLAVVGCGLGKIYPPENRGLAQRIADGHGAVLSEFPVDQVPDKTTFPMRNRIVSGLSRGLLVVECPAWSGAMITANLAAEQGRNVYAVPGPIDRPSSEGCHKLIKEGAKLVTSVEDILDDYDWLLPPAAGGMAAGGGRQEGGADLAEDEKLVYEAMDATESHVDELAAGLDLPVSRISVALMKLVLKRLVQPMPGQYFRKA